MVSPGEARMDRARQILKAGLERVGISENEASRRIGRASPYLHQYFRRKSPWNLSGDDRNVLARMIGVEPSQLISPPKERATRKDAEPEQGGSFMRGRAGVRDLPVMTIGTDFPVIEDGEINVHMERPARLFGVSKAYGAKAVDDGLGPLVTKGDVLLFDPSDVIQEGDVAAVLEPTPDGHIKAHAGIVSAIDMREIILQTISGKKVKYQRDKGTELARMVGMLKR